MVSSGHFANGFKQAPMNNDNSTTSYFTDEDEDMARDYANHLHQYEN